MSDGEMTVDGNETTDGLTDDCWITDDNKDGIGWLLGENREIVGPDVYTTSNVAWVLPELVYPGL